MGPLGQQPIDLYTDDEKLKQQELAQQADKQNLYASLAQAGSTVGGALSGGNFDQSFYEKVKENALRKMQQGKADIQQQAGFRVAQAQRDQEMDRENALREQQLERQDKLLADQRAREDKIRSQNFMFENEQLAQKMQADQQKEFLKQKLLDSKPTEGQKVLDREFAKEYNDWETRGKGTVMKNLGLLEQTKDVLKERQNQSLGTSGRFTGRLPDFMRSEESIRLREDVHRAAQATLRATLGAQFTEKEGERIMNASYNEKLSPEENIRKLDAAIEELKLNAQTMDKRAEHFGKYGTLVGYKDPGTQPGNQQPIIDANDPTYRNIKDIATASGSGDLDFNEINQLMKKGMIKVQSEDGTDTRMILPEDFEAAKKDGYREVE